MFPDVPDTEPEKAKRQEYGATTTDVGKLLRIAPTSEVSLSIELRSAYDAFCNLDQEACMNIASEMLQLARQPSIPKDVRISRLENVFAAIYTILDRDQRLP